MVLYQAYFTIVKSQNKKASEKQHFVLWHLLFLASTEYEKLHCTITGIEHAQE